MRCKDIIEVTREKEFAWCSCKNIAISGGLTELRRYGAKPNSLEDCKELSKFDYHDPDFWDWMD